MVEEHQAGQRGGHALLLIPQERLHLLFPVADHQGDLSWDGDRRQSDPGTQTVQPGTYAPFLRGFKESWKRTQRFTGSLCSEEVLSPTQVEDVHHGLHPQGVVQGHHRHGVGVACQLGDDPLPPPGGDRVTPLHHSSPAGHRCSEAEQNSAGVLVSNHKTQSR